LSFNGNLQPSSDSGEDLTTKGDVHGYSTENTRVPVGTDGHVLTARASNSYGIAWEATSGGGVDPNEVIMAATSTIGDFSTPSNAVASSASGGADWSWDGTSTGWTLTNDGGTAAISSGQVSLTANSSYDCPRATIDLYSALGSAYVGNTFVLRFKVTFSGFTNTASGQAVAWQIGIASSTSNLDLENPYSSTDGILASRDGHGAGSDQNWYAKCWNSASNTASGALVSSPFTAVRYCELVRTAASSCELKVYTDAGYSTLEQTLTISSFSSNPSNMRYLFLRIFYQNVSDTNTVLAEDFKLWNNTTTGGGQDASNAIDDDTSTYWESNSETNPNIYVDLGSEKNCGNMAVWWNSNSTETQIKLQSSTNASAWSDLRTINVTDLTAGQYNYIRFNVAAARYFRIYGNNGAAKVMVINEIKNTEFSTGAVASEHGHLDISSSDTSLALDGT